MYFLYFLYAAIMESKSGYIISGGYSVLYINEVGLEESPPP